MSSANKLKEDRGRHAAVRGLPAQTPQDRRREARIAWLGGLALALLVLCVYWQVTRFDFIKMDDFDYVVDNSYVRTGLTVEGIRWAFTSVGFAGNWHPLTWISHIFDAQLFGLDPRRGIGPGGHHLVNVIFHIANTLLLLALLTRLTGRAWPSLFVSALFALHPLHVESVAWVAERKDVLSTFFLMLTLLAYTRYVRRPGIGGYLAVLLAFAAGLMAKPMLVTLPVVMLALDYWPLDRFDPSKSGWHGFSRLLLEKIPLLALSAASAVVTLIAQRSAGAINTLMSVSIADRVANAIYSYVVYVLVMFWPSGLAASYPMLRRTLPVWEVSASAVALVGVTWLVLQSARTCRCIVTGWVWYIVMLVPVIGLVRVGSMVRADRYTYVPSIGIFMIVAYGLPELLRRRRARVRGGWERRLIPVAAGLVILALAACTYKQAGYWRDSTAVFTRALDVVPENWFAQQGLADVMLDQAQLLGAAGRQEEAIALSRKAIPLLREALASAPAALPSHTDLARALGLAGDLDGALEECRRALEINPRSVDGLNNMATFLFAKGQVDEAILAFRKLIELEPRWSQAHFNLGVALQQKGDLGGAAVEYREVLRMNPENHLRYWALFRISDCMIGQGRGPEAVDTLREAVRINEAYQVDERNSAGGMLESLFKHRAAGGR